MPATEVRCFRSDDGTVQSLDWLRGLKKPELKAYAKCLDTIFQLEKRGFELRRPICDILRKGIYELRTKEKKVHYRILYFFYGQNVVCLSHGIRGKKGKIDEHDIDIAIEHRELVAISPDKYTTTFDELKQGLL